MGAGAELKTYVVHPGVGTRQIGAGALLMTLSFRALCELYGVDPGRCINADRVPAHLFSGRHDVVHLFPLKAGHYVPPSVTP